MKVSLVQTGGVLGLRLGCVVDTATLDPDAARVVEEAVASGDLFEDRVRQGRARDGAEYLVEVETPSGRRGARFTDADQGPSAAAVLRVLRPMMGPLARDADRTTETGTGAR